MFDPGNDGLPSGDVIGGAYALFEVALALLRRSRDRAGAHDRNSLPLVWGAIFLGVVAAHWLRAHWPGARFSHFRTIYFAGIGVIICGIALRWWAIVSLGKFFTVDVAIAQDQFVVSSGPYRLLRHPSYTGALMAFVGYGLCLGNYVGFFGLMLPVLAGFLWRIHVEERALLGALGDDYRSYARGTKRLVPFVY